MSLTLTIECDVTNCSNKAEATGRDPDPIGLEEFVIDQDFGYPDGWTRTDDLSETPEGLHLCPEHCASDVGIVADIRAVKAEMRRLDDLDDQERARISREDYYKLIGLLALATEHNRALGVIEGAAYEITKETQEYGHTSDAVAQSYTADELLRKLGIEVADV